MSEKTLRMLKRLTALGILAVTFTLMGILFASRMEWTADTQAQDPKSEKIQEAMKSTGLLTAEGESPFVAVAAKVKPAVVNISARKEEKGSGNNMFDFGPFRELIPPDFHKNIPRWVTSGGSGIIVDREGYILTNNHVVGDAKDITVKDAEGHEYKAEVIGTDPESDVALIKVKDAHFKSENVAELGNSETIKIGDWAIAVGNPLGLDWTVTVGVISAKGRSNLAIQGGGPTFQDFIQTDASINFGNSGGPLVNIRGQVIGVNTAVNTQGQGIGFAQSIVAQLRTEGQVSRGYLGILPRDLDDATREALKLDANVKGVFVDQVEDNTPAQKGGLEDGDVITAVDDKPVEDPTEFRFRIAAYKPHARVKLDVLREGKPRELSFELGDRKEYLASTENDRSEEGEEVWLGLHVEPLNSTKARQMEIEADHGVLVTTVEFQSPAQDKIRVGDVIIEINRTPVKNLSDYRKITRDLGDTKEAILFRLLRGGRKTFVALKATP